MGSTYLNAFNHGCLCIQFSDALLCAVLKIPHKDPVAQDSKMVSGENAYF